MKKKTIKENLLTLHKKMLKHFALGKTKKAWKEKSQMIQLWLQLAKKKNKA